VHRSKSCAANPAWSCEGCDQEQPGVAPGNLLAWLTWVKLEAAIFDGMGGINISGIEAGLRLLEIPRSVRPELFSKLLLLCRGILEKRQKHG
jgi:hypothetical protein